MRTRAAAAGAALALCLLGGCATPVADGGAGGVDALEIRAEGGDAAAQLDLAERYARGLGLPLDTEAALRWYERAAEEGSAEGAYQAALILSDGGRSTSDREREIELLDLALAAGFAPAQSRRADLYLAGNDADEVAARRARSLYRDAAEQGLVEARFKLGTMLANGRGGARDLDAALSWLRLAADAGDARAQLSLGDLHLVGIGVPASVVDALGWYRRSAEQGAYRAQSNLGDLLTLERYGSVRDVAAGMAWYRRAAEQGYARAQSRLATLLAAGFGSVSDPGETARWYRAAAEQGYAPAQCHLGSLYYRGAGVEQDLDAAERWFGLAAAQAPAGIVPVLGFVHYDCREFESDAIDLTLAVFG